MDRQADARSIAAKTTKPSLTGMLHASLGTKHRGTRNAPSLVGNDKQKILLAEGLAQDRWKSEGGAGSRAAGAVE
jgi:ABC-type cobalamin/Fe3+-siderophores transport system ATPase subunit